LRYGYGVAKSKPDVIGSSLAHLLREKRQAKGLSMYVVAKRARMSHSMISRVEHELCRPTLDTLLRIADAMEIDLWPLIKRAEQSFNTAADNSTRFLRK
jgi:transcriptional regulator with XRE-family HTH domain